jgi:hypothetical protein
MPRYSFEVSSGPITVTHLSDVELADRNALWDRIVDLARTTREPGAAPALSRVRRTFPPDMARKNAGLLSALLDK